MIASLKMLVNEKRKENGMVKQVCPICTGYVTFDSSKPYLAAAYNWLFGHQCGNADDVDGVENMHKFRQYVIPQQGQESAFEEALGEDSKRWSWNLA